MHITRASSCSSWVLSLLPFPSPFLPFLNRCPSRYVHHFKSRSPLYLGEVRSKRHNFRSRTLVKLFLIICSSAHFSIFLILLSFLNRIPLPPFPSDFLTQIFLITLSSFLLRLPRSPLISKLKLIICAILLNTFLCLSFSHFSSLLGTAVALFQVI